MAAEVISVLEDKIKASTRASAMERAWKVAKALEGDRAQIDGLQWVEPVRREKGIDRCLDFAAEFSDGVTPLYPTPLSVAVIAPGNRLFPGEDINAAWTMPLLTRMSPAPTSLSFDICSKLGSYTSPVSLRNRIDVVSFLPFPRADAPADEQFNPEFYVQLYVRADLGKPDNYFGAVVRYGGKVIKQHVTEDPRALLIFSDPSHAGLFSAEMLVNLSAAELASTPANAGELEIFLYRITKGLAIKEPSYVFEGGYGVGSSSSYGRDKDSIFQGFTRGGDTATRGGSFGGSGRLFTSIPGGSGMYKPSPAAAPKEVGDVRVGEGSKAGKVETSSLEGYRYDSSFGVQPICIRFLGVREASEASARDALHSMAQRYRT